MSSSVAHVEKASYRFKQQLPHCLHSKPLGGMSVTNSSELLDFENYVYQIIFPVETIFVGMIFQSKLQIFPVNRNRFDNSESHFISKVKKPVE
jgi:hypothetical protein